MSDKLTIPDDLISDSTFIGEAGDHYECTDLAAVEKYIVALTVKIRGTDPKFPRLIALFERDRDALLELHAGMSDG